MIIASHSWRMILHIGVLVQSVAQYQTGLVDLLTGLRTQQILWVLFFFCSFEGCVNHSHCFYSQFSFSLKLLFKSCWFQHLCSIIMICHILFCQITAASCEWAMLGCLVIHRAALVYSLSVGSQTPSDEVMNEDKSRESELKKTAGVYSSRRSQIWAAGVSFTTLWWWCEDAEFGLNISDSDIFIQQRVSVLLFRHRGVSGAKIFKVLYI